MIKFKHGSIGNPHTGITKDVIVKTVAPNNVKDILIGGGTVLAGITYLAVTAFRNGAKAYAAAEYKVFEELDLLGTNNV